MLTAAEEQGGRRGPAQSWVCAHEGAPERRLTAERTRAAWARTVLRLGRVARRRRRPCAGHGAGGPAVGASTRCRERDERGRGSGQQLRELVIGRVGEGEPTALPHDRRGPSALAVAEGDRSADTGHSPPGPHLLQRLAHGSRVRRRPSGAGRKAVGAGCRGGERAHGRSVQRQQDLVEAGRTPASVQSRRRRQHVTPLQPIVSLGTSAQVTPVRRT
jgi:hypothetical protein